MIVSGLAVAACTSAYAPRGDRAQIVSRFSVAWAYGATPTDTNARCAGIVWSALVRFRPWMPNVAVCALYHDPRQTAMIRQTDP
jgi:hypothetical protein